MDVSAVMKQNFVYIEWYPETLIDFNLTSAFTHCIACVSVCHMSLRDFLTYLHAYLGLPSIEWCDIFT